MDKNCGTKLSVIEGFHCNRLFMRPRNLCDLAQKRQMYVDFIYAWLYMGVLLSDHRYNIMQIIFVQFQFHSHNCIITHCRLADGDRQTPIWLLLLCAAVSSRHDTRVLQLQTVQREEHRLLQVCHCTGEIFHQQND